MIAASLSPAPLDAAAFAPFGSVIRFDAPASRTVNEGSARRADTAALFEHAAALAPVLALYRADAQMLPLQVSLFERHPHSTQTFVSIDVAMFLVVVAPSGQDGLPLCREAKAFVGRAGTGLSYRRDQWHAPLVALGRGGDLLMLMAEGGPTDCVEHRLADALLIQPSESMTHGA